MHHHTQRRQQMQRRFYDQTAQQCRTRYNMCVGEQTSQQEGKYNDYMILMELSIRLMHDIKHFGRTDRRNAQWRQHLVQRFKQIAILSERDTRNVVAFGNNIIHTTRVLEDSVVAYRALCDVMHIIAPAEIAPPALRSRI